MGHSTSRSPPCCACQAEDVGVAVAAAGCTWRVDIMMPLQMLITGMACMHGLHVDFLVISVVVPARHSRFETRPISRHVPQMATDEIAVNDWRANTARAPRRCHRYLLVSRSTLLTFWAKHITQLLVYWKTHDYIYLFVYTI